MPRRLMVSDIGFGGKPLNMYVEIPCRDELKPYLRSAAITASKLARFESIGNITYSITREVIDALREFPKVYEEHEAPLAAEAVETYLRAQLGWAYKFVDPEIEWLPETPENLEKVRAARQAEGFQSEI